MNMMTHPPEAKDAITSELGPVYNAHELLSGSVTARIVLDDNVYTLRLTRSGKLILTK